MRLNLVIVCSSLMICLSACQSSNNQNFQTNSLSTDRDYETAYNIYLQEAERGNAEAQVQLGIMYQFGTGVAEDYEQALKWFSKAAVLKNTVGQYKMGVFHHFGYAVDRDYTKAKEWYELAIENNHASAYNNLGVLYERGLGVAKDEEKAMELFEKAVEYGNETAQIRFLTDFFSISPNDMDYSVGIKKIREYADDGNKSAMNLLGRIYDEGKGVPVDDDISYSWYVKAAHRDIDFWSDDWEKMSVEQKMDYTSKLLDRKVRNFRSDLNIPLQKFESKAKLGDAEAQYLFALSEEDYTKAMIERQKVALGRNAPVDHGYGIWGTPAGGPDYYFIDRFVWLTLASENGYEAADRKIEEEKDTYDFRDDDTLARIYLRLGENFEEGVGIEKDYHRALQYYQSALDKGDTIALQKIGRMYERGLGVERDYKKAISFYQKIKEGESGRGMSQYYLAHMYETGKGFEQSYETARKMYLSLAIERGFDEAFLGLWRIYFHGLGVSVDRKKAFMYLFVSENDNDWEAENGLLPSAEYLAKITEYFSVSEVEEIKKVGLDWYSR